jgi:hypothetical protein
MKNHENKVYAGGIRNRINRVVMRTGGLSTAHYNSNYWGQGDIDDTYAAGSGLVPKNSVIERTVRPTELPVQRDEMHRGNPPVMDNDV